MGTTFTAVYGNAAADIQFLDHRVKVKAKGHQWVQAMDPDLLSTGNKWLVPCWNMHLSHSGD
jgi:hypothetical protein